MTNREASVAAIRWRARIGGLQSRSPIIIESDRVYVGTCGDVWNVRDRHDGVHCFDLQSGEELWFTPTLSDVNEIAIAGTDLIAPTDNGDVFVIERRSGEIRYIVTADSAVLGKPIVYRELGGWSALVASLAGSIYSMTSGSIELVRIGEIGGGLRASLIPLGYDAIIAAAENGTIYKGEITSGVLRSHPIVQLPTSEYGGTSAITAAPLVEGVLAFVGYARDTHYDSPAVACIDYRKEEVAWLAAKGTKSFGNVRSIPALVDGVLVVASAYSDSIQLLEPNSGSLLGQVLLGQEVFQQWSSPVKVGPHHVAIGRVDGVCSIIDVRGQRLVSSISLATAEIEPLTSSHRDSFGTETFALYPGEPAPMGAICATPAFDGKCLVLGTTDGSLAAVNINLGAGNDRPEDRT